MFEMKKTKLMAILNVTADSFYSESRAPSCELAIARAMKLQAQGADILDIGGQSSRPGAGTVDESEELRRLAPVFEKIKHCLKIPMSIDTTRPRVAKLAIESGATLVNDISGLCDPQMVDLVAGSGVDVCVMHMRGTPITMQGQMEYREGVVAHLLKWFEDRTEYLIKQGVDPSKIMIDPGIGFAKNVEDNFRIIHNIGEFKKLGFRVLVGTSRKSFMGKIINKNASQLLAATLAVNTMVIQSSVDVIRVHDVEEHRDIIDLLGASATMR
jgi:dihydropteroate synthase